MSFLAQTMRQMLRQVPNRSLLTAGAMRPLSISPVIGQQNKPATESVDISAIAKDQQKECLSICERINRQCKNPSRDDSFAVVHLCGKQFKVTPGDIIPSGGLLAANDRRRDQPG
ncbi:GD12295 [Drosophila simulans]|uniref:GD12295 n=1 Tax=Drosophila simulans TaxID=7240 RepID=B4QQD7_DROSI|nr:GD12295 [Drosophila simulans]